MFYVWSSHIVNAQPDGYTTTLIQGFYTPPQLSWVLFCASQDAWPWLLHTRWHSYTSPEWLALFVNIIQLTMTWTERLSILSWCLWGIILIKLIAMGRPTSLWGATFPRKGVLRTSTIIHAFILSWLLTTGVLAVWSLCHIGFPIIVDCNLE